MRTSHPESNYKTEVYQLGLLNRSNSRTVKITAKWKNLDHNHS